MIDEQFDRLTRVLARGVSRHTGLGGLAGAGLSLLPLGRRERADVSAQGMNLNQTGWGFSPGAHCVNDYQCDNSFPELGITYCREWV
jgi:hypothetical protein